MRVPARVFADAAMLHATERDRSLEQLVNVTTLPGIVGAALAMPDVHEGYGFPVGGVAAIAAPAGVVSPGGIGYDINCGVRLLALPLAEAELGRRREALVHEISRAVPTGMGRHGSRSHIEVDLRQVLADGAVALRPVGLATDDDLARTESGGRLPGADPDRVSSRALERGQGQLGTLGSGNHFLELQQVEEVFDERTAHAFGLVVGALTILIHTGSRGLGHQVCTDYVRVMDAAEARYGIVLPDRQLACAPQSSPEGTAYLGAMAAAANFAFANRQALAHVVRGALDRVVGAGTGAATRQVYDVAHNVAKREHYLGVDVLVHRKGATRAFPADSPDLPPAYQEVGQPVFVPGSMGTSSFVLAGEPGALERSFGTVCHGAGRRLSRTAVRRTIQGHELRRELEGRGIVVRCPSNRGLAEEAPAAYKDVDRVVGVVEGAGLARRVARLRPLGVVKG